ncbi:glutaminase [Pontibacillus chungwhensis BH030062]|uniref:Glutaminase n=1 Tax=Pontibacillus chungwhensis BH030062 TaxID=1385513 RepID=A0A0A2URV8_9BACI|nr:glutaminase A [Pontibacillus chungwhensis]KGP91027.1 glutaminase [Pontibacillus chungwhensis BH030062]
MVTLSNEYLKDIITEYTPYTTQGEVVQSLPCVSELNQNDIGIAVIDLDQNIYTAGTTDLSFSLQSASKVVSLMIALEDLGEEKVFQTVGMEPMGDFFNTISHLEADDVHRPFNPMVNAGAIAICSLIKGSSVEERFERIMTMLKSVLGHDDIHMNEDVYKAERRKGDRNRALAYYMSSTGSVALDPEEALDLYFRINSIQFQVRDLALLGLFFANGGKTIEGGEQLLHPDHLTTIEAIMMTSGMYNESGRFAVNVGFPCKSGISGGIFGAVPGRYGIGVIGPAINPKGNSVAGSKILERLSKDLGLNIFHPEAKE